MEGKLILSAVPQETRLLCRSLPRAGVVLVAVSVLAALALGCGSAPAPEPTLKRLGDGEVTTVYVVRHAEKLDGDDPPLSTRGKRRAQALAEMLGDDDIAAVFATEYQRTKETVGPLARALGLDLQLSPAARPRDLARRILDEYRGVAVVAAAHSNTVPQLLVGLGVEELIEIRDTEYGDLFVVVVESDGGIEFTRHRFGD